MFPLLFLLLGRLALTVSSIAFHSTNLTVASSSSASSSFSFSDHLPVHLVYDGLLLLLFSLNLFVGFGLYLQNFFWLLKLLAKRGLMISLLLFFIPITFLFFVFL